MTTHSEPRTETYLQWLWQTTHKTNSENAEIQTFMKPMNTEKWRHIENWYRKPLQGLWPPTKQIQKVQKPNINGTYEHLKTTTHSEPGTEKDLQRLRPLTHKTNSENAKIRTFMKPMNTEKWRRIQNWHRKHYDGYGHRPTKQIQNMQKSKHSSSLQTLINDDSFRAGNRNNFTMAMATDPYANSEVAEIQACLTPMNTEKW